MIAKLRVGNIALSDEERGWLAGFIGFQMVRGPAFRDLVEASAATIALQTIKAMGRRPEYLARRLREVPELKGRDWTPEEIEDLAKKAAAAEKHFKVATSPRMSLAMMHVAADVVLILATMRWEFLYAGGRERFVTSDAPVTQWNPNPPAGLGPGLKVPGTEVTFPVSPRICLRGSGAVGPTRPSWLGPTTPSYAS